MQPEIYTSPLPPTGPAFISAWEGRRGDGGGEKVQSRMTDKMGGRRKGSEDEWKQCGDGKERRERKRESAAVLAGLRVSGGTMHAHASARAVGVRGWRWGCSERAAGVRPPPLAPRRTLADTSGDL